MAKYRKSCKRTASFLLALAMLFTLVPVFGANAAQAQTGTPSTPENVNDIPGITHTQIANSGVGSDLRFNVLEIAPNAPVRVLAGLPRYGQVEGFRTVGQMATSYGEAGYDVVAAMNTGLFGLGVPAGTQVASQGAFIRDGILMRNWGPGGTSEYVGAEQYLLGWKADGTFVYGLNPFHTMNLSVNGGAPRTFTGLNTGRGDFQGNPPPWSDLILWTEHFAPEAVTPAARLAGARDVYLEVLSGRMAFGETLTMRVVQAAHDGVNNAVIAPDHARLVARNAADVAFLNGLNVGDIVTINHTVTNRSTNTPDPRINHITFPAMPNFTCTVDWTEVVEAVPAALWVHRDGIDHNITQGQSGGLVWNSYRPRTVFGVTADGTQLWAVASGNSSGMSIPQARQQLVDRGAVNVWNFDGGGSSTMTIGNTLVTFAAGMSGGVPSTFQRSIANGMVLVRDNQPPITGSYAVTVDGAYVGTFDVGETVSLEVLRAGFSIRAVGGLAGITPTIDGTDLVFTMPDRAVDITLVVVSVPRAGGRVGSFLNQAGPTNEVHIGPWVSGVGTPVAPGGSTLTGMAGNPLVMNITAADAGVHPQLRRQFWHLTTAGSLNTAGAGAFVNQNLRADEHYISYRVVATMPFNIRVHAHQPGYRGVGESWRSVLGTGTTSGFAPADTHEGKISLADIIAFNANLADSNIAVVNGFEIWGDQNYAGGGNISVEKFDWYYAPPAYGIILGDRMGFVDPDTLDGLLTPAADFTVGQTIVIELDVGGLAGVSIPALGGINYSLFAAGGRFFASFAMPDDNLELDVVGGERDYVYLINEDFEGLTELPEDWWLANAASDLAVNVQDGTLTLDNGAVSGHTLIMLPVDVWDFDLGYTATSAGRHDTRLRVQDDMLRGGHNHYGLATVILPGNPNANVIVGLPRFTDENIMRDDTQFQTGNWPAENRPGPFAAASTHDWLYRVRGTQLTIYKDGAYFVSMDITDYYRGVMGNNPGDAGFLQLGANSGSIALFGFSTTVVYDNVFVRVPANVEPEETPNISINFPGEFLTGFATTNYTINGVAVDFSAGGVITNSTAIDPAWFGTTLSIVRVGDGEDTSDSKPQMLFVPARPAAPTGLTAVATSSATINDGRITGVTTAMEFSTDGGDTWTNATGIEITGLAPGAVRVRVRGTATGFAGLAAMLTIEVGAIDTWAEAEDTPNSWAIPDMIRARQHGIVGDALPQGVLYRQGAPRWYIAELLASYMVVYTGLPTINDVVSDWKDRTGADITPTPGPFFPDIPETHPLFDEIQALAIMGILQGGEFGGVFGFGPDYTLTRAQAAVGLARMMEVLGYTTIGFPPAIDFADWHIGGGGGGIQSWARDAVAFLYYHEVMLSTATTGTPPGDPLFIFNPNFEFHTQQLLTGMVRMLLETDWRNPPTPPEGVVLFDLFDLPTSGWVITDAGGGTAQVTNVGGAYTFVNSGGGRPNALFEFDAEMAETMTWPREMWPYITLHFDIEVASEAAILTYDWDTYSVYSIFVNGAFVDLLPDFSNWQNYFSNAGDLLSGHYTGTRTLHQLLNSRFATLPTNEPDVFHFEWIDFVEDTFVFAGMQFWPVGGNITVREFRLTMPFDMFAPVSMINLPLA
ncbi:MAG: phosphodiester glycosidase family protein [Oscillospiraceae bacterium]|nr:phosphodiester glycosidase family protein [Oscillospiraceae bacterium]